MRISSHSISFKTDTQSYMFKGCMFKVCNRNTRTRSKTKLIIKTPERRHIGVSLQAFIPATLLLKRDSNMASFWCLYIVNFGHISHVVLLFLLFTSSRQMLTGWFLGNVLRNLLLIYDGAFCRSR